MEPLYTKTFVKDGGVTVQIFPKEIVVNYIKQKISHYANGRVCYKSTDEKLVLQLDNMHNKKLDIDITDLKGEIYPYSHNFTYKNIWGYPIYTFCIYRQDCSISLNDTTITFNNKDVVQYILGYLLHRATRWNFKSWRIGYNGHSLISRKSNAIEIEQAIEITNGCVEGIQKYTNYFKFMTIKEELYQKALHPSRIEKMIEEHGIDVLECF